MDGGIADDDDVVCQSSVLFRPESTLFSFKASKRETNLRYSSQLLLHSIVWQCFEIPSATELTTVPPPFELFYLLSNRSYSDNEGHLEYSKRALSRNVFISCHNITYAPCQ